MSGVTIGESHLIAAGFVVTKNVEANFAGVITKIVKLIEQ